MSIWSLRVFCSYDIPCLTMDWRQFLIFPSLIFLPSNSFSSLIFLPWFSFLYLVSFIFPSPSFLYLPSFLRLPSSFEHLSKCGGGPAQPCLRCYCTDISYRTCCYCTDISYWTPLIKCGGGPAQRYLRWIFLERDGPNLQWLVNQQYVSSLLPSFLSCFFPSFLPLFPLFFLPSLVPSLVAFLPSFPLCSFPGSFLLPSFLPLFLPWCPPFLPSFFPSFRWCRGCMCGWATNLQHHLFGHFFHTFQLWWAGAGAPCIGRWAARSPLQIRRRSLRTALCLSGCGIMQLDSVFFPCVRRKSSEDTALRYPSPPSSIPLPLLERW